MNDPAMGKTWLYLLLASLLAVFGAVCCQHENVKDACSINVTVTSSSRSLEVRWESPTKELGNLQSYRIKVWPVQDSARRWMHSIPRTEVGQDIFAGLEPNKQYNVQVIDRNYTCYSDIKLTVTEQLDFLMQVWEQRVFVLIGAILVLVLALFILPFICCCCCCLRNRKRRSVDMNDTMEKRDTCLPSAEELKNREMHFSQHSLGRCQTRGRLKAHDELSYSKEFGSTTNQLNAVGHTPPPSYSHTALRSQRSLQAIDRQPLPAPFIDDFDSDVEDDYQNDVFVPPPLPPKTQNDIYGNVPY